MEKKTLIFALTLCFSGSLSVQAASLEDAGAWQVITDSSKSSVTDHSESGYVNVFQKNGGALSFNNSADLSAENGAVLFLNGTDPMSPVNITNTGTMSISGAGYAIYEKVYEGRPVNVTLTNSGTIDRIKLTQSENTSLINDGTINGTISLGPTASFKNYGTVATKDTGSTDDNIISTGINSSIINGIKYNVYDSDEKTYYDELQGGAVITTGKISMTDNATIANGGKIIADEIVVGDNASITNNMSPYQTGKTSSTVTTYTATGGTVEMAEAATSTTGGTTTITDGVTSKTGGTTAITGGTTINENSTLTSTGGIATLSGANVTSTGGTVTAIGATTQKTTTAGSVSVSGTTVTKSVAVTENGVAQTPVVTTLADSLTIDNATGSVSGGTATITNGTTTTTATGSVTATNATVTVANPTSVSTAGNTTTAEGGTTTVSGGTVTTNAATTSTDSGTTSTIGGTLTMTTTTSYTEESDDNTEHNEVRKILAGKLTMGNNATLTNEMGGIIAGGEIGASLLTMDTLTVGKTSTITNGAEPSLNLRPAKRHIIGEDGEETEEDVEKGLKTSYLASKIITMDDDATLNNYNTGTIVAQNILLGENATLNNLAQSLPVSEGTTDFTTGIILLSMENDTQGKPVASSLIFKDNGTLNMQSLAATEEKDRADGQGKEEVTTIHASSIATYSLLSGTYTNPNIDLFQMGDNATISSEAGILAAKKMTFGDNATITTAQVETENAANDVIYARFVASDSLAFGNSANTDFGQGEVYAPTITYKDDGTLTVGRGMYFKNLTMGKNSNLTVADILGKIANPDFTFADNLGNAITFDGITTLDSNSNVTLTNMSSSDDSACGFGGCRGGTISGTLKKADNAKDVKVTAAADEYHYAYLNGTIDVNEILVQQNSLRVAGDIKGKINMNSDTVLKFVGESVYIHDPIKSSSDATNTTVVVALQDTQAGERNYYTTTNTIDVNHILIESGGMIVTRNIKVDDIKLDSNAILKVKGNYVVGDLVEVNGDSVNTTFVVDVGQGNAYNSSGSIVLDRVLLESGIYNINHPIVTVIDPAHPTNEEGLEMGSNTIMNVNTSIDTNRLVRQQDAASTVVNTTVNLNNSKMTVHRDLDIDTLNLNNSYFTLLDESSTLSNTMKITNDANVNLGSIFEAHGTVNFTTGDLYLNNGGRLILSSKKVSQTPITTLTLTSDLYSRAGSVIDFRTQNPTTANPSVPVATDKMLVNGTWHIEDGTRLIMRYVQPNTTYTFAQAGTIDGDINNIATSFLWEGTQLTKSAANEVSVSLTGVKTLKEGIGTAQEENILNLADALDKIHNGLGADDDSPFYLDNVLYAKDATDAVSYMKSMVPDTYLASHKSVLKTAQLSNRNLANVMGDIRAIRTAPARRAAPARVYGRSGGDFYYRTRDGHYVLYSNDTTSAQARGQSNNTDANVSTYRTDEGGVWVKPFYAKYTQDDINSFAGYDMKVYGLNAGFDGLVGDNTSLGLNFIFGSGDLTQSDDSLNVDITTYGIGLYGNYIAPKSKVFTEFFASVLMQANESKRTIASLGETAKADYDSTTFGGGIAFGKDFEVTRWLALAPKVGVNVAFISTDDIQEKGASSALKVSSDSLLSIQTPVELSAVFKVPVNRKTTFLPELRARWAHEFGDTEATSTSSFMEYPTATFKTKGMDTDTDLFTLGLGASLSMPESQLFLRYDYDFSSTMSGHNFHIGYMWSF